MNTSTTVEWLSKAIAKATRSAKFCVSGCLPATDPGIEIEHLGVIKGWRRNNVTLYSGLHDCSGS